MTKPEWRGDPELLDRKREWIRKHMPAGRDGVVVEDLDVVLRLYGQNYCLDQVGNVRLIEIKVGIGLFRYPKKMTFGLLDDMLRGQERYGGFYLIYTATEDWENEAEFVVNGQVLDPVRFKSWLEGATIIAPVPPRSIPEVVSSWRASRV